MQQSINQVIHFYRKKRRYAHLAVFKPGGFALHRAVVYNSTQTK
jgi:hypothetical protein